MPDDDHDEHREHCEHRQQDHRKRRSRGGITVTEGRRGHSLGGFGGRTVAIVLAIVAVLALAVPIGLSRLAGGGASSSSEGSAAGGAPGLVQRDAGPAVGPEASDSVAPAPDAPAGSAQSDAWVDVTDAPPMGQDRTDPA